MIFPDVAFWEGTIDFNVMKSKTDYVILKASQFYVDPQFERNRSECERVGLPFGAYHFYDDRMSPLRQAILFCGLFTGRQKPVEIFCDWENEYRGEFGGIKNVVAFMQECEKRMSMEMGMYTGYYWFMEKTNPILNFSQLNYLKTKKLWLASYNDDYSNEGALFVKVPRPWKKMDIWQFTDRADGKAYGCQSAELDMNERLSQIEIPGPQPRGSRMIFSTGETYTERL